MKLAATLGFVAGCLVAAPVPAGEDGSGTAGPLDSAQGPERARRVEGLPANKWVKLPTRGDPGYLWSSPVWAPGRGQVAWAELPITTDGGKMGVSGPYGQLVWVAKYGVFVNLSGGTWLLRPDFSQINWGAAGPAAQSGGK